MKRCGTSILPLIFDDQKNTADKKETEEDIKKDPLEKFY